jgi:DNA segregation ATPase FtsK/SpoIIIE-like protein
MGRTFATRAIADLVRLVGRLSVDGLADPTTKPAHRHFVSGYLTALEATGIVPTAELLRLKHTCEVVLDGNLTLQDLRAMKATGNDTDPTYLRAVSLVNRALVADATVLASQLDTSEVQARRLIERMQADGLVNEPDLFGIRTLKAQPEVRHG